MTSLQLIQESWARFEASLLPYQGLRLHSQSDLLYVHLGRGGSSSDGSQTRRQAAHALLDPILRIDHDERIRVEGHWVVVRFYGDIHDFRICIPADEGEYCFWQWATPEGRGTFRSYRPLVNEHSWVFSSPDVDHDNVQYWSNLSDVLVLTQERDAFERLAMMLQSHY